MDAVLIAGGIPQPKDPLYPYTQGGPKALLDVAGKPMAQWVLDALGQAQSVDKVIIIGLEPEEGLRCARPLVYLPNQGGMLANIVAGIHKSQELTPGAEYVLIVSADIPALRGEMVDWLTQTAMQTRDELYYGVVPREVMEKRYPNSKRTWTRLKNMEVCGADINVVHVSQANEHLETWEDLLGKRKSPFQQAAVIGYDTLLLLLLRQLSIEDVVKRVLERIHVRGRAIIWPYAEAGMDVDKPHQLEMMRKDLSR